MRRGYPALPHPAAAPERIEQAVRLHLAVEEGACLHQGQGAGDHPRRHEPTARSRATPAEPELRGWANYFRHGVSTATFDYLSAFSWRRVICWLRHKHRRATWKWLRRRYLPGWRPPTARSPCSTRRRSRSPAIAIGADRSPRRGPQRRQPSHSPTTRARGEPDAWERACPVRECGSGKRTLRKKHTAPRPDPHLTVAGPPDQPRRCVSRGSVCLDPRREVRAIRRHVPRPCRPPAPDAPFCTRQGSGRPAVLRRV